MEAFGGEEYSSYSFTTSPLDGGKWLASRPGRALPPGKEPPVPIVQEAGWGPRAGLDTEARGKNPLPPPGIEPRSPGRPARSQTLYCLSNINIDCKLKLKCKGVGWIKLAENRVQ
jgi:hypothetical protein